MDTLPIYSRLHALAHLDDESFQIACSGNEELQMICNGGYKPGHQKFFNQLTDYLYMIRSQALFDKSLLKYQPGLTWKEFYDRLTELYKNIRDSTIANAMTDKGKLMELKILFSIGIMPDQNGADRAAMYGDIAVLQWMKENNLSLPDQDGANMAAEYGSLEVLKWMQENNLPLPNQRAANMAAFRDQIDVLRWLKDSDLLLPDQHGANLVAEFGGLEVLNWMKENNLPLPNREGANRAARHGELEVLKWMKQNNLPLPNREGINYAVRNHRDEVLRWLASLTPPHGPILSN